MHQYFQEIVKDMSNSKEQNKKIENELETISQVMKGIQDDSSKMALTADSLQLNSTDRLKLMSVEILHLC